MENIKLSGIRRMFEMATADSINLSLGEPDFNPPLEAIDAATKAMRVGKNKYSSTFGLLPLREAIAQRLKRYNKDITKDNVVVTQSGSEALFSAALTAVGPGDRVLIPDPGFVLYSPQVTLCGGIPVTYNLKEEKNFDPDPEEIENLITPKTKAIILNSPNNPTGGVISEKTAQEIIEIAEKWDLFIISDEVYDRILYEGKHFSFLGRYDKTILINSFSKTFAMTGWRLGYMAAKKEIIDKLSLAHYHIMACPSTPLQYGALAVMDKEDDFISMMMKHFRKRRKIVVEGLKRIPGFSLSPPGGAFYAFPSVRLYKDGRRLTSEEVVMNFLKGGVITVPGSAFGKAGEGFLRLSFATSEDKLKEGINRLAITAEKLQN